MKKHRATRKPAGRNSQRDARTQREDSQPSQSAAKREVVYGVGPVTELLRSGRRPVEKLVIAAGARNQRLGEILAHARGAAIPVHQLQHDELDRLAPNANHQGVVAVTSAAPYASEQELIELAAAGAGAGAQPLILVVDGVSDPRNLGAIIRTAVAAGVDGLFIPGRRAAGLTETVAKTSAGALEYARVARAANVTRLIENLKEHNIWTVGATGDAVTAYYDFDFTLPCALVVGGEGKGIRRLVREKCDALVRIPMDEQVESLNVAVATGVILFEVRRQRTAAAEGEAKRRSHTAPQVG